MDITCSISCPNCRHINSLNLSQLIQIIDLGQDPKLETKSITQEPKTIACSKCGFAYSPVPALYHAPAKDLLLIYIPDALSISKEQQELFISQLIFRITDTIPPEERRSYLLHPKRVYVHPEFIKILIA